MKREICLFLSVIIMFSCLQGCKSKEIDNSKASVKASQTYETTVSLSDDNSSSSDEAVTNDEETKTGENAKESKSTEKIEKASEIAGLHLKEFTDLLYKK